MSDQRASPDGVRLMLFSEDLLKRLKPLCSGPLSQGEVHLLAQGIIMAELCYLNAPETMRPFEEYIDAGKFNGIKPEDIRSILETVGDALRGSIPESFGS